MLETFSKLPKPPLVEEDIAILMALWNELDTQPKKAGKHREPGLSRYELAQRLVAATGRKKSSARTNKLPKQTGPDIHSQKPFRTKATLFKHFLKLKQQYEDILSTVKLPAVNKPGKTGGQRRDAYQLAIGNVITWPETARMVLEVWDEPHKHLEKEQLILRMEAMHLKRQNDGRLFDRTEVERDLDFVVSREYLYSYGTELMADDKAHPDGRLHREYLYLAAVAEHVKKA